MNKPFKYCGDINYASNPASGEKGWYQADVYESDEADAIFESLESRIAQLERERDEAFNEAIEEAALAKCSICRGMAGFIAVPILLPELYPWNSYWHPYDESYGNGWTLCDSSVIRALKRPIEQKKEEGQ